MAFHPISHQKPSCWWEASAKEGGVPKLLIVSMWSCMRRQPSVSPNRCTGWSIMKVAFQTMCSGGLAELQEDLDRWLAADQAGAMAFYSLFPPTFSRRMVTRLWFIGSSR